MTTEAFSIVLAVVAHADDEALGCGGTLARHVAQGDQVSVVFMADGVTSRQGHTAAGERDVLEERNQAAVSALEALGITCFVNLGLPDNRLDSVALLDVVQALEAQVGGIKPDIVYTHCSSDLNVDHRITNQAVLTAFRPQPGKALPTIYSFEVASSTEWQGAGWPSFFSPNHYVGIHEFWSEKEKALSCYEGEMRSFPHARSMEAVKAKAVVRGAEVGLPMAEAFMLERQIIT